MLARLFLLCLWTVSLGAQALPPSAIPIEITASEALEKASAKSIQHLTESVENALAYVANFPPATDNLFSWKGDKKNLEGLSLKITLTLSNDPIVQAAALAPGGRTPSTDALTYLGYKPKDEVFVMGTLLIVDKLYLDEKGEIRKDAAIRLVTVLAHELYGNVQNILSQGVNAFQGMTLKARKQGEIKSFEAGIAFLERIQKSELHAKFSEATKTDLKNALTREKQMLETWKK